VVEGGKRAELDWGEGEGGRERVSVARGGVGVWGCDGVELGWREWMATSKGEGMMWRRR
jgi:hypothetical protein